MNFKNMISKRNKSKKNNKKYKATQKGGVGFKLEVASCPIGGRPAVVATSDCPSGYGPGSVDFANAVYGSESKQQGGSRRRSMSRSNKLCKGKSEYKNKKGNGSCKGTKRKLNKKTKRIHRK